MFHRESQEGEVFQRAFETPVYLTHTQIVNEAGIHISNTAGKYAFNFMVLRLSKETTLVLLCTDSLQVEDVNDFVTFYLEGNNFLA
jgi:hypothetical protein